MKHFIISLAAIVAVMSVNAASFFSAGDTLRINPNKLDGYQPIEFWSQLDGYVDCYNLTMTYPTGVTPKLVAGIVPLEGQTIAYYDRYGRLQHEECPLQVSAAYGTIASHTTADGYWLQPQEEGEEMSVCYEYYGSVKWEPGCRRMFMMNFYIDPKFRRGYIRIDGHLASGFDRRGPVLSDYNFIKKTYLWVGYKKGDVSGNETFDIGDVTLLIDYVLGRDIFLDEFQLAAADINGDGKVDIDDVAKAIDNNLGK